MLNGIDPIIIFEFSKLTEAQKNAVSKIPIVSSIVNTIGLPPIPIYLSEKLTGLFIDTEDRNIDIETTVETLSNGLTPNVNQKAISSNVRIVMKANKSSIGLTLISALADLIVPKVSSKEYSITYLHGPVTIFRGLLHSFAVTQNANDELMIVTLELSKQAQAKKAATVEVKPVGESVSLDGGALPASNTAPVSGTSSSGLQGPPTPAGGSQPNIPIGGAGL